MADGTDRAIREIRAAARRAALAGGLVLERKVVQLLSQKGTGRTYNLYNPRRTHTASSPGQPPAVDRGTLRRSIVTVPTRSGGTVSTVRVGTNLQKAAPLEFGGRNRAPRPFMRPAFGLARRSMARVAAKEFERL